MAEAPLVVDGVGKAHVIPKMVDDQEEKKMILVKCEAPKFEAGNVLEFAWPEWTDAWLTRSTYEHLTRKRQETFIYARFAQWARDDLEMYERMVSLFKDAAGKTAMIVQLRDGVWIMNTNPFVVKLEGGFTLPACPKEIALMFRLKGLRFNRTTSYGSVMLGFADSSYEQSMNAPLNVIADALDHYLKNGETEWHSPTDNERQARDMETGNPRMLLVATSMVASRAYCGPLPRDTRIVNFVDCPETLANNPADKICRSDFFSVTN